MLVAPALEHVLGIMTGVEAEGSIEGKSEGRGWSLATSPNAPLSFAFWVNEQHLVDRVSPLNKAAFLLEAENISSLLNDLDEVSLQAKHKADLVDFVH